MLLSNKEGIQKCFEIFAYGYILSISSSQIQIKDCFYRNVIYRQWPYTLNSIC